MRDFTLHAFRLLCLALKDREYNFITFSDYLSDIDSKKFVIMRHDVDRAPERALQLAILENEMCIKASYYFRVIRKHIDEKIIIEIGNLGHEIGYHYEDFSLAKGNYEFALERFKNNLEILRKNFPVKTICMHGNPLSRWDNRLLWEKYNYHDFAIIGEPYFDLDFNRVLYLTDTGRNWDSVKGNIRDKIDSVFDFKISSTFDIIQTMNKNEFPDKVMLNIHPHRWTDETSFWFKELIWQNIKNVGKRLIKW